MTREHERVCYAQQTAALIGIILISAQHNRYGYLWKHLEF